MYETLFPIVQFGFGRMGKIYRDILMRSDIPDDQIFLVDPDPVRIGEYRQKYQGVAVASLADALALQPKTAFVLSNSPTHMGILEALYHSTVKHVFTEKPTVLASQLAGLSAIGDTRFRTFATGYVINYSPALQFLIKLMADSNLRVVQGTARWQKDRTADNRPSAGDVEDELVHPIEVLMALVRHQDVVQRTSLRALVDDIPFVDAHIQSAAHAVDASFPLLPPSTAAATIVLDVRHKPPVKLFVQSSFVGFDQDRRVEVLLGDANANDNRAVMKAQMLFDTPQGDVVSFGPAGGKCTTKTFVAGNKLFDLVQAFLNKATTGKRDPLLTDFDRSVESVLVSRQILDSSTTFLGGI